MVALVGDIAGNGWQLLHIGTAGSSERSINRPGKSGDSTVNNSDNLVLLCKVAICVIHTPGKFYVAAAGTGGAGSVQVYSPEVQFYIGAAVTLIGVSCRATAGNAVYGIVEGRAAGSYRCGLTCRRRNAVTGRTSHAICIGIEGHISRIREGGRCGIIDFNRETAGG